MLAPASFAAQPPRKTPHSSSSTRTVRRTALVYLRGTDTRVSAQAACEKRGCSGYAPLGKLVKRGRLGRRRAATQERASAAGLLRGAFDHAHLPERFLAVALCGAALLYLSNRVAAVCNGTQSAPHGRGMRHGPRTRVPGGGACGACGSSPAASAAAAPRAARAASPRRICSTTHSCATTWRSAPASVRRGGASPSARPSKRSSVSSGGSSPSSVLYAPVCASAPLRAV